MKKQFILALILSTVSLFACEEEPVALMPESIPATAPSITSIYPKEAFCGTEMVIFGENFGASTAENYVTFSGTYAEVTGVGHGMVTVRVPKNLAQGFYTIRLSANGRTCVSTSLFTIM